MTLLQSCAWLLDNEGSFKPRSVDGDCTGAATTKETVRSYIQREIYTYLRVPASTGKSDLRRSRWHLWTPLFRLYLFEVCLPAPQVTLRGYPTLERLRSWPGPSCCVWTWKGINPGQRSVTLWSHYWLHCWKPWAESALTSTCPFVRVTRACSLFSNWSSSGEHQAVRMLEVCKAITVYKLIIGCQGYYIYSSWQKSSFVDYESPPLCICSMYSKCIHAFM